MDWKTVRALLFLSAMVTLTTGSSLGAQLDAMSRKAIQAIDDLTVKSLACSVYVPLGGDQTLHVLDFPGSLSTAPPLVLLHGISSCAADYYPLIRLLQPHCSRVVAIDLPGHGNSAADAEITLTKLERLMDKALGATLKHLGISKCVLLGNSLGGFVACKYAARHSASLHSLVLISPAGAPLDPEKLAEIQSLFNIKTLGEATSFLNLVFGQRNRLPFGLRHIIGWACRERTRKPVVQRILQEATTENKLLASEVAGIKCPICLIWGQNEEVFGQDQLAWFLKHLPSKLLTFERPRGVGHIPHLDAMLISKLMVDFFSKR